MPTLQSATAYPIVIHFKDGRIDRGTLLSSLLSEGALRYRPQSAGDERRSAQRLPFLTEVKIDHVTVGRAIDISARGLFLETLTPFAVDTVLKVALRLDSTPIEAEARVVFTDPGVGVGLEFKRLPAAVRHRWDAALHQLTNSGRASPLAGRRRNAERRDDTDHQRRPWDGRKTDRRSHPEADNQQPVEVALSEVKSIFFVEPAQHDSLPEWGADPLDRQVSVEFRDGETIQGTLREMSPEASGFFVALRLDERHVHTVYIVKSAVKSIQTAF